MFTGCRKGEVLRSEVRHWDLEGGCVEIWSKKDKKDVSMSCRVVNILPPLREVMEEWFGKHPGGRWTVTPPANLRRSRKKKQAGKQLTEDQAHDHFKRTLSQSTKWSKIKGLHVLRHSFISICAQRNVPQPQIDAWVGHSTEEQRRRYRHLYPEAAEQAAHSLRLFNGHTINQDAT
ncbi:MAG: site-specific integrase, partial [Chloroflexi bacterium]|nr:site-specific integrase [Chloroflexota bacterium]